MLSSKAGSLAALQGRLRTARVGALHYFTVADWRADADECLLRSAAAVGEAAWIVRSSCHREDTEFNTNAGAFLSVLDVLPDDRRRAVEDVIASYGDAQPTDEVLIQSMLQGVVRAGVAFSCDPNTCAPYRVINWSEGSDTAAVTGGRTGRIYQQAAASEVPPPEKLAPIIKLVEELETLLGQAAIDCEFAVTETADGPVLWLLQVRVLTTIIAIETARDQAARLNLIAEHIQRGMRPHPFVMGRKTVYGVMPDWNPAEIVGIRPRPLALSLYRDLVTDSIWAYQRNNYGYRNLRSFPLMPNFFGLPYIDVRLSFNSFIPADLDEGLAGRLADYYIDRLLSEPQLHDKVEFEIVFSCYTVDLPERLERLTDAGFSEDECVQLANSLRLLTNRILNPQTGLWRSDAAKLDTLRERREQLLLSDADPLERIFWLLEDGKRYGTLPFAGLARAGFVAVQLLRSLVSTGVLTEADYDAFFSGITTVSGQLARDRAMLDKASFLSRYGHLRPGTYDILCPRYDEAPDLYFDWSRPPPEPRAEAPFTLKLSQMRDLAALLQMHDLESDAVALFDFLQSGVELRELAKFYFTQNLSDILSLIATVGESHGFSRDDLSYCDLSVFKEMHINAAHPKAAIAAGVEEGRRRYAETKRVALPPLITRPEDVWAFEWPATSPNFITQKLVAAHVLPADASLDLTGAIVCIPSADPGFDWLFSHPIAGLVTAWGGANSHMAIRAGELGLPAMIGVGEVLYRRYASASRLLIDCAGRRAELLS